ncbi:MAG: cell division protein FtsL [Gammaproteobacteria bacterium]|nr:cell division protein FtsL [Gammaproteobacteria bacterium]MBA3731905.1 cell division protein FtsL [Gammaproteobacteria bacterium]
MKWGATWLCLLFAAVLVSALGVVYSKHQNRKLFIELQALQTQRDELSAQWGRLQLEQSTWAAHGRIENIAAQRLRMQLPEFDSIVTVQP